MAITETPENVLEEVFRAHHAEVFRFLRARSSSRVMAEDLTTETFVAAALHINRGGHISIGWLMTVARRRLVDQWRRDRRQAGLLERLGPEQRRLESIDEADRTVDPSITEAMLQLSERQRKALALRYLVGLNVNQVAIALETSYSSAESLLARARRKFARSYVQPATQNNAVASLRR